MWPVHRPIAADRYGALCDLVHALAAGDGLQPASIAPIIARGITASRLTLALPRPGGAPGTVHALGVEIVPTPDDLARLRAGQTVARSPSGADDTSILIAGIRHHEELLGWVCVARADGSPYDADDQSHLSTVAALIGLAAGVAQPGEPTTLDPAVEQLALALTASLEFAPLVERMVTHLHAILGQPIVIWGVEGERMRAVARAGGARVWLGEESLFGAEFPEGGTDGPEDADRLMLPLRLGTRVVACLEVGPWSDGPPAPAAVREVKRLAGSMAAAIENARLHEEVRRLSLTDPLVQLPNRRQLDLYLAKECAAAARGRPLALVLYDLDRFKLYNDTHGHLAGDDALVRFAGILRTETRAMNLAVRYGGEEFVTVLSGSTVEGARLHAERVRSRVEELFGGALTVSAGVAEWRPEMTRPADLIGAADRQLYRAKVEGRNRVCVAER